MAEAHYNHAVLLGQTIDIHLEDSTSPVAGWSGLAAIIRQPTNREVALAASRGIEVGIIFEVARQGSFVGANLRVQKYKVKYGDVYWEVTDVTTDDAQITASGRTDAAVYTLMCKRLDSGVGLTAVPT